MFDLKFDGYYSKLYFYGEDIGRVKELTANNKELTILGKDFRIVSFNNWYSDDLKSIEKFELLLRPA